MGNALLPELKSQLEQHVTARTGRRIKDLAIELRPERVILHGQTISYYVKQLAQHGVREILPEINLENSIVVHRMDQSALEALAG